MIGSLSRFFLVAVCCFILAACGDKKAGAPNPASMPVPVNIYELVPERATFYEKFPGTVVAMMQVDLRPEVQGTVTGIFFTEGAHVTKGQKLYTIDDRKNQAAYNQADAGVRVAEANLDQAQKDADRYIYLSKHDAVAKQTLEHAMTALQNAKQQLSAAKQERARANTDLGYSVVKAPFAGTIGISQVKLGNTVVIGQTILNTISTEDPMAVDFAVNEKQISRFLKLQHKNIPYTDSVFTLILPDNTIYDHVGKISIIDRGVNPQTGTTTVRLVFPNAAMALRAGMSCIVRVRNDDTTSQLLIPSKAIVEQMGEYFVYVAKDTVIKASTDDKQKEQKPQAPASVAAQRKVQLGATIADKVIVRQGLERGERIIVDGVQKLHDGSLISIGAPEAKK